jgi:hypothetical protein
LHGRRGLEEPAGDLTRTIERELFVHRYAGPLDQISEHRESVDCRALRKRHFRRLSKRTELLCDRRHLLGGQAFVHFIREERAIELTALGLREQRRRKRRHCGIFGPLGGNAERHCDHCAECGKTRGILEKRDTFHSSDIR